MWNGAFQRKNNMANFISKIFPCTLVLTLSLMVAAQQQGIGAQISISSTPEQATISCDGIERGIAPVAVSGLLAGPHLVKAVKEGYLPAQRTVTVSAEAKAVVDLKLTPVVGLVLLRSTPSEADIEINGAHRGRTPLLLTDLPLGKYRLKASSLGYLSREVEFELENRAPQLISVSLTSDSAVLAIKTEPPGASVKVNGLSKGDTPCSLDRLPAGENELVISLPGHVVYRSKIKLQANQTENLEITLKPMPGVLSAISIPTGARVFVDDKLSGQTPLTLESLEAGTHAIKVEMDGYTTVSRSLEFQQGEKKVEEFRLEREVGILEVMTKPEGVKVFVDGKEQGVVLLSPGAPVAQYIGELAVGSHVVSLRLKGYGTVERKVQIEKGQTISVKEILKRVFVPDTRIRQRNGEVLSGIFAEKLPNGDIRMETQIGIYKTIEAADIASMEPVRN